MNLSYCEKKNNRQKKTMRIAIRYHYHNTTNLEAEPVSLTFHSVLRKLCTEPSIGYSSQILVHLGILFQWRRFLEIDQPETRIAYGGHVC